MYPWKTADEDGCLSILGVNNRSNALDVAAKYAQKHQLYPFKFGARVGDEHCVPEAPLLDFPELQPQFQPARAFPDVRPGKIRRQQPARRQTLDLECRSMVGDGAATALYARARNGVWAKVFTDEDEYDRFGNLTIQNVSSALPRLQLGNASRMS